MSSAAPARRKAFSIITRAPKPTAGRMVSCDIAMWPRRVNASFKALVRSGAVSTSVPSRSKTIVASLRLASGTSNPRFGLHVDRGRRARHISSLEG
jgi:hypothetical protein